MIDRDSPSTQITDLSPLFGMSLKYLSAKNIPCDDLSPIRDLPLTEYIAVGERMPPQLPNDYSWIQGVGAATVIVDPPRRYFEPDIRLFRGLNCANFNRLDKTEFWSGFDAGLARIEDYVGRVNKMSVDEQIRAIGQTLVEDGFDGPGSFTVENSRIVGLKIKLGRSNDGLWPLRPLGELRVLEIGSGDPQRFDLSALTNMHVEALNAPLMVLAQNRNVIREMKSLKTVNGRPVSEFLQQ